MTTLYLDLETYSKTPIAHGTHAYAEGAEILLIAYALDEGPVGVWDAAANTPAPALWGALHDPAVLLCAHNSHFDRTLLRHVYPGLHLPIHRWRDTLVKALAHSLPGSLGELCGILGVPQDKAKDKAGRQLMHLFCKPLAPTRGRANPTAHALFHPAPTRARRATRNTHPAEWARFVEYARLDVEAMREIDKRLPNWNFKGQELALWHLDQAINDRGVRIDRALVRAAIRAVEQAQRTLAGRTQELTDGEVGATTQRDTLLRHLLEAYGIDLPDLQQSTLERRINDPGLPPELRELLAIRLQASTSSTAKYKTLANAVSDDGRLRGTLQFNGASRTGRWAGRLFQPQNLPRPSLRQAAIDLGIEALKAGCEDLLFDDVMSLASSTLRGCIVAPEGKKLVIADLANIEGRVLAWLAGENWKLNAFRDYDAGTGHDLYKLAYAKSFGVRPKDVTKDQRQVGKVQELALGYQGGVGAFLTFAAAYGIDLEAMGEQAIAAIPPAILGEATHALEWTKRQKRTTFGLSDRAWRVCEAFKRSWRAAHPEIVAFWAALEGSARYAVSRPGEAVDCRRLKIQRDGAWLRIRLPSGRALCYPSPRLDGDGSLSYEGVNPYSRK